MSDPSVEQVTLKLSDLKTPDEVPISSEETSTNESTEQPSLKVEEAALDPSSPLYSTKSFEELGLSGQLLKNIYAQRGWVRPAKIQEETLPILLRDPPTNLIAQSQSGSGKTAAYILPALIRVDPALRCPQALCIVPNNELGMQVTDWAVKFAKDTGVEVRSILKGDRTSSIMTEQLIIGTPGSVCLAIQRKTLVLNKLKIFVIDEADDILAAPTVRGGGRNGGKFDGGKRDQAIRIRKAMSPNVQVALFSATFGDEDIKKIADVFAKDAEKIYIAREKLSVKNIKPCYIDVDNEDEKLEFLRILFEVKALGQSIVFCNQIRTAERVGRMFTSNGNTVNYIHSKLEPDERKANYNAFKDGTCKVLISTNVLARGIDIDSVNVVVNYDLPEDANGELDRETYYHRVGRTGRYNREGICICFSSSSTAWASIEGIEAYFGIKMSQIHMRKLPNDPDIDVEHVAEQINEILGD